MNVENIYDLVMEFEDEEIVEAVQDALAEGVDPQSILNDGLVAAMDEVGVLFSKGDLFVPEMLMAATAMKAGLEELKPVLGAGVAGKGTIVIGTVEKDLHDIGKNLVAMMMESSGFTVIDLGIDVPKEKFIEAAKENKADMICLSALLTTTMANMRDTVEAIKADGIAAKVMVGGAPVTEEFATEIH
ncbi:MAG: corrinoid protein, partial [Eubacterium sp.]